MPRNILTSFVNQVVDNGEFAFRQQNWEQPMHLTNVLNNKHEEYNNQ
jgi:hypothetical protein